MWGKIYGTCPKCNGSIMKEDVFPEVRYFCINCGWDTEPKIHLPALKGAKGGRPPRQINSIPYDYRNPRTPNSGTDSYLDRRL